MKKGDGFSHYDGDQDGNQPPYPGVIIEEMIDSASQIGAPADETKAINKMGNCEVSPQIDIIIKRYQSHLGFRCITMAKLTFS